MFRSFVPLFATLLAASACLAGSHPPFRFAEDYTVAQIMTSAQAAERFVRQLAEWEGEYFAVARHPESGLTYDGFELDAETGKPSMPRTWSAPSKECLDLAVLIKALAGDPLAGIMLSPRAPARAPLAAKEILERKLASYRRFHAQFPGYGGWLPWFRSGASLTPTDDWVGELPGLDNGEWAWALLVTERGLRRLGHTALADGYRGYIQLLRSTCVRVFYDPRARKVRGDVKVVTPTALDSRHETIQRPGRMAWLTGEHGVHEGQMMVLWVTLYGEGLPSGASDAIWSGIRFKRLEHRNGTTWQGFWGSSHESWAFLYLPYGEAVPEMRTLLRIREIIRTQNAAMRGYPGLASSTNRPGLPGYLDGAGIEDIGSQEVHNNHVFATYGAFPLLLECSRRRARAGNHGLAWLLNMLRARRMQGPLGMGESATNDGRLIAPVKTMDGSVPVLLALMGGVAAECSEALKQTGRFEEFRRIMRREYLEAFGLAPLREPSTFALPPRPVPEVIDHYHLALQERGMIAPQSPVLSGGQFLARRDPARSTFPSDALPPGGTSLDGDWTVTGGARPGHPTVRVPGHWLLDGYPDTTRLTLARRFAAPERADGQRVILRFDGAIYRVTARLDGHPLVTTAGEREHAGYFMPFEYDVTDRVRAGATHTLEVDVENANEEPDRDGTSANGGTGFPHWGANKRDILGILDFHDTKPGGAEHQRFNVGGLWRPVTLIVTDPVRIGPRPMVRTTLLAAGRQPLRARADAQLNASVPVINGLLRTVEATVTVQVGAVSFARTVSLKPGPQDVEVAGVLRGAKLWWPWLLGEPALHEARIAVEAPGSRSTASQRFGVRELVDDRGRWSLNGYPIRALGDNGIPSLTPGSYTREDAVRDVSLAIRANVQVIRVHAHVPSPRFLEACDQLGLMVWQDFPQQWLCRWEPSYRAALLAQIEDFARVAARHPSVILVNTHNENKYFDPVNAFGLPKLPRGIWMHAARPAEQLDRVAAEHLKRFWRERFALAPAVTPRPGVAVLEETGVASHPYYGYYYGEGWLDFAFLPSPEAQAPHRAYDALSPHWGWREDAHPDAGSGAVPTASYERVAGGGGRDRLGPDEFGFQGMSRSAARLALREVLSGRRTSAPGASGGVPVAGALAAGGGGEGPAVRPVRSAAVEEAVRRIAAPRDASAAIDAQLERLPWGYVLAPERMPAGATLLPDVLATLAEHSFHAWAVPLWLKPEKDPQAIGFSELLAMHQEWQAWGARVAAEIYRRAGYGQVRFLLFASEDDSGQMYSTDWAVVENNRTPKRAYEAVRAAYQPVLASSEVFGPRLVEGERWLDGLWVNNDAPCAIDARVTVRVDRAGEMVRRADVDARLEPGAIVDLSHVVAGTEWIAGTGAGPAKVTLRVTDAAGRKLSENVYARDVLPGLGVAGEPARIVERRRAELERHFAALGLRIDGEDGFTRVVNRLERARRASWATWKQELEADPEALYVYPEFTDRIRPLVEARLARDAAREKKAEDSKERERAYADVVARTRRTLNLTPADLEVLVGRHGARIPVPLFWGRELTTDAWFAALVRELEQAGAPRTAVTTIRKLSNCRAGHWFWRQVMTLKALRAG